MIKLKKIPNMFTIATLLLLIFYVLSLLVPVTWAFYTSFKTNLEYLDFPLEITKKWHFENFLVSIDYFVVLINKKGVMTNVNIEMMLVNSLLYSVGSAFFATLTVCITSYATARFNFKFSKVVFMVVLITMTLPIVGNLPSEIQLLKALGLYDTIWGMWICKANFLGFFYLVFFNTFRSMPKDITDAAYIDGASNFSVLLKIAIPLAASTFMTVMLIRFVEFWNDYTVTLTYMPTIPTLAYGLYEYSFSSKPAINNTPLRLAGSLILIIPVIIIFTAFHKRLMGNIAFGGLKE